MKWANVSLLVIGKWDEMIERDANFYIKKYQIPSGRVMTLRIFPGLGGKDRQFDAKQPQPWKNVLTEGSKLIVLSHGSEFHCGNGTPHGIAILLRNLGISRVGLISFKGCHLGRGAFLEQFRIACEVAHVQFGWCLAYTKSVAIMGGHDQVGFMQQFVSAVSFGALRWSDETRVKVVRGTLTVPLAITEKLGPRFLAVR
jgi:hypothetical protein